MSDRTDVEIPATGLLPENQVEQPVENPDRPKSQREIAMERIYANFERTRAAEMGQAEEIAAEPPDSHGDHAATRRLNAALGEVEEDRDYQDPYAVEAAPEPAREMPEAQGAAGIPVSATPSVAAPPAATAPQTFAIDIDGQQLHVTQEQLLALGRMGAIANRELYRYQTQPQQFQPAPVVQALPSPPPPVLDQEQAARTVKAIQYGDEATATQALIDYAKHVAAVSQPQMPQIDLNAIYNNAANVARAQAQLQSDTQIIRQEYADIFANPIRSDAAGRQLALLRQENAALGKYQSDLDLYREAGNRVRAAFGTPQPGAQVDHQPGETGTTAPQAPNIVVRRSAGEIDARKRAAPRAMSQVIDRRSPAPQAPRPPTGSEIVELMRKARGQTSMK